MGEIEGQAPTAKDNGTVQVPKAKVRPRFTKPHRPRVTPRVTPIDRCALFQTIRPAPSMPDLPPRTAAHVHLSPPSIILQFIDDVEDYMKGKDPEQTLNELQTLYQQYKQIEQGLQQNRIRLGNKLPEIKRALETVKLLKDKAATGDELDMDFELTDSVFAKAKVRDAKSVYLWLGANVMLEYSLDEAETLLTTNHLNCSRNLETNKSDLAFVKDNVTITEVSIARVYNWDVKRRKDTGDAEKN